MKKLIFILAMFFLAGNAFAKTADLFRYDSKKVEKVLVTVNALDQYVSVAHVAVNELDLKNPLLKNFAATPVLPASGNTALGIPSFIWGLVLGWVGILIVYLVTEDKEETKKALWGCIAGTVAWLACYFIFWGAIFASAATTTY